MNNDILQLKEDMAALKSDAATPFFQFNKVPAISDPDLNENANYKTQTQTKSMEPNNTSVAHESIISSKNDIPEPAEPKTLLEMRGAAHQLDLKLSVDTDKGTEVGNTPAET